MSRIILVVLSLILSFVAVVCMGVSAAYAAPKVVASLKAPKGASPEFIAALAGVQCSELYEGDWVIKDDAGEALDRLDEKEAKQFDAIVAKWAKKACAPTNTNNTTEGK